MTASQKATVDSLVKKGWTIKQVTEIRLNRRFYPVVEMWDGMGTLHTINYRGGFGGYWNYRKKPTT